MTDTMTFDFTPKFDTKEEERQFHKQRLAAGFRIFGELGFEDGAIGGAGHITVRDPIEPDTFWVNPYGVPFGHVRASDLIRVDHKGKIVHGEGALLNGAAFAIHSRIHEARPDVMAAAHSHSIYGKSFSALGQTLRPLSQDACAFYEDHVLFTEFSGVVLDTSEGDAIAAALGDTKGAVLQNHGLLTVGGTVDEAVHAFVAMDRACHAQLLAQAAGDPIDIPHDIAKLTHGQVGSRVAMWFGFQPMYDAVVRRQPDLLD